MPGAVVPCLFWCVPVGSWPQRFQRHGESSDLEDWWEHFTEREGVCHDLGLLLIKGRGKRAASRERVDLKPAGAVLYDLMPAGVDRFVDADAFTMAGQSLLVLSAAYPQPGWGVLLECGDARHCEMLIENALGQLGRPFDLSVIVNANRLRHEHEKHAENEPSRPDKLSESGELGVAIHRHQATCTKLWDAITALERQDKEAGVKAVKQACQAGQALAGSAPAAAGWADLSGKAAQVRAAIELLKIQGHDTLRQVGELYGRLIELGNKSRSTILETVNDELIKRAAFACISLTKRGVATTVEDCVEWARVSLESLTMGLLESARHELSRQDDQLASLLSQKTLAEAEWQRQQALWMDEDRQLRAASRQAAVEAAETLWQLGPAFLVQLERVCKQNGIRVRSIPWDPARMVGWKLAVCGPECGIGLQTTDLWSMAKDMAKNMDPEAPRPPKSGDADGGYFTDYVHYVAMSKPDTTPYSVTRDLLQQFMPSQLAKLIAVHGGEVQDEALADRPALARQVLDVLGWRERDRACEQSLAGCIDETSDSSVAVKRDVKLRPVVESFCKDFIDTVVQELGFDEERLWTEVRHRHPLYRSHGGRDDWNIEVQKLTVGPAVMLCECLLPIAFPKQDEDAELFTATLRRLGVTLNKDSSTHHAVGGQPHADVAELVRTLLTSGHALVGELPWHLEATAVYGEQPKVLSGMAWSHSRDIPRQIRVMDWTGAATGRTLTLWNKSGRNPIITDPVFIRRPGRG
jgi:hypothetical protein